MHSIRSFRHLHEMASGFSEIETRRLLQVIGAEPFMRKTEHGREQWWYLTSRKAERISRFKEKGGAREFKSELDNRSKKNAR